MKRASIFKIIAFAVLMELIIGIVFFFIGHALAPAPIDKTTVSVGVTDDELITTADKMIVKTGDITCEEKIDKLSVAFYWTIPADKTDIFKSNETKSADIIFTDSDSKEVRVIENVVIDNKTPFKGMYSIEVSEFDVDIKYYYRTDYMAYICMGIALVIYLFVVFIKKSFKAK